MTPEEEEQQRQQQMAEMWALGARSSRRAAQVSNLMFWALVLPLIGGGLLVLAVLGLIVWAFIGS